MFSLSSLKKLPFHGQSPTRGISCDPLLLGRSLWLIPLGLNWNVTIGTAGFATGPLECGFVGCVVNYNPIIIEWWKTKVFPTLSPPFGGGSLLFMAACWDGGVPLNNGAIEVRLRRCHCTYFHSIYSINRFIKVSRNFYWFRSGNAPLSMETRPIPKKSPKHLRWTDNNGGAEDERVKEWRTLKRDATSRQRISWAERTKNSSSVILSSPSLSLSPMFTWPKGNRMVEVPKS